MQGIVMGAAQMLTQGFLNCTNIQDRDSVHITRHGLPNRLQTSSCAAIKVLGAIPQWHLAWANRKSIIKMVKQDCVEMRPNRNCSCFGSKLKCLLPPKNLQQ